MNISKKPVSIISFNSNLGLIEPAPGKEPGVKKLPDWLRKFGFFELIEHLEEIGLEPPGYTMNIDPVSDVRNADAIAAYAIQQSKIIQDVISRKYFALVLGGDCSIIIGNALGLKQLGDYRLFFIDGHTDFMWPSLSSTHGAAGMDLAIVTGHGHAKLSNINYSGPYFKEENVWCVGNREFDVNYVAAIENTAIHYYDLNNLRSAGVSECIGSFFDSLTSGSPDGFWIHLDVDVLDPSVMPAVDSPDPGGLSYHELNLMLESLLSHPLCTGLEITILDPDRDPDGKIAREFIREVGTTIQKSQTSR